MTRRRLLPSLVSIVALAGGLAIVNAPGCSLGEGTGSAAGWLNVPECWAGPFDLRPNFFAAVPSLPSLLIRVQNGGDYESFSDGIAFVIDDVGEVRGDPSSTGAPQPSLLGDALVVGLPASATAPGTPVQPTSDPTIVHATLYLEYSCRIENAALYATTVSLDPNDTEGTCLQQDGAPPFNPCGSPAIFSGDSGISAPVSTADATATGSSDAGLEGGAGAATGSYRVGTSTIIFHNLFDGNEDESNASQRLSWADFDLYFADPREACSGGLGPPPPCRGHLSGSFKFYFERGRPAQPFP